MMLYLVVVCAAALGFWFVWSLIDRLSADRARKASSGGDNRSWYELLGVSADVTRGEIIAAYDRESAKYAPDEVRGMTPEFQAMAAAHSGKLQWALREGLAAADRMPQ